MKEIAIRQILIEERSARGLQSEARRQLTEMLTDSCGCKMHQDVSYYIYNFSVNKIPVLLSCAKGSGVAASSAAKSFSVVKIS